MAQNQFPRLRELHRFTRNGPISLHEALGAALEALKDPDKKLSNTHAALLQEHTSGWFGLADDIRKLLAELGVQ